MLPGRRLFIRGANDIAHLALMIWTPRDTVLEVGRKEVHKQREKGARKKRKGQKRVGTGKGLSNENHAPLYIYH